MLILYINTILNGSYSTGIGLCIIRDNTVYRSNIIFYLQTVKQTNRKRHRGRKKGGQKKK